MNTKDLISGWIKASNTFDTKKYLSFYLPDAILDDPSVGRKFSGHAAIAAYFNSYFIGYNTHTEIVHMDISDEHQVHLEVKFTGDFPEGNIGGTFDFTFKNGKISCLKADLIY
jgi:ketosteroid isomerase-like protein